VICSVLKAQQITALETPTTLYLGTRSLPIDQPIKRLAIRYTYPQSPASMAAKVPGQNSTGTPGQNSAGANTHWA